MRNIGGMTAGRVDAAVRAVVGRDSDPGGWAQVAADDLTAGEGEEVLGQALVQDFLWYRLPAKYPERAWRPLARAARALLGELGLERYAVIAASDTTTTILDAWREYPARASPDPERLRRQPRLARPISPGSRSSRHRTKPRARGQGR